MKYDMQAGFGISRMTLGTAQFGMDYGIANREGRPDEEKAFSIIDAALENDINCLDTAAAYGDSERIIGRYFRSGERKREEITIVTKLRLGQIKVAETEEVIMKSVEQSINNLGADHIDILLLHNAKEYQIYGSEITRAFEKLLAEGLVKGTGASCYDFSEIENILENDIFQAFQIPVNLLNSGINKPETLNSLRNRQIFARSVFLQGLFFMDPLQLKGNLKEAGIYISRIRDIASDLNVAVSELAIRYVSSLNNIDSIVIGADNPVQVLENLKFLRSGPFPREVIKFISGRLKGAPDFLSKPYLWDKQ